MLGAHTLGFNAHSSAIAVIGDYTSTPAPAGVLSVVEQAAAYKLGAYGYDPAGRTTLTSAGSDRYPAGQAVSLYRISGHRDVDDTECPGDGLYAQLGEIRAAAGGAPAGLRFLRLAGTVRAGARFVTGRQIRPRWSTTRPSALLDRFDVLVDCRLVASLPHTERSATLRLSAGPHVVTVRAVHLSGRTAETSVRVLARRRGTPAASEVRPAPR